MGFEPATLPGSRACIPGCCCCGFVAMRFCAAAMGTLICDVGVVIVTVRFCVPAGTTARRDDGIGPMRTGPESQTMTSWGDAILFYDECVKEKIAKNGLKSELMWQNLGSDCGTEVELTPCKPETVGSVPSRSIFFKINSCELLCTILPIFLTLSNYVALIIAENERNPNKTQNGL